MEWHALTVSKRCLEPGEDKQVSRRAPELQHQGIPDTPARKLHRGPTNVLMHMQQGK